MTGSGRSSELAFAGERRALAEVPLPLDLAAYLPGATAWELEIGFGKGRFLLRRAEESPTEGFCGIEMAGRYYRLAARRASRRGLGNLMLLRGEALYLLSVALPQGFARAIHVYFPDPWPKSRHHKRRFLDPEALDLILEKLLPGGTLFFATDHCGYGEAVMEVLSSQPGLRLRRRDAGWEGGPRTNYEAKFVREGRPILRLEARWSGRAGGAGLHPAGELGVVVAPDSAERTSSRMSG